jgi:hypothetical protein
VAEEERSTRDLYALLELAPSASEEDIRRAFRTLAGKYHPDRSPGDSKAALRFKQINAAYQVLGDPDKKQQYDELTMPVEDMALARRPVVTPAPPGPEPEIREQRVRRRRSSRRKRRMGLSWTLLLAAPVALVALSAFRGLSHDTPAEGAVSADGAQPAAHAAVDTPASAAEVPPSAEGTPLAISDAPRRVAIEIAPPPLAEQGRIRTITGDKYSFDLPESWQPAPDGNGKGQRWLAPSEVGSSRPSVLFVVSAFTGDTASYFDDLDRRPPSGIAIDGESWESATKPDGLKREGRLLEGHVLVARFVEYVVASRGHGYELMCSGAPDGFDGVRPTCDRILASLRIR